MPWESTPYCSLGGLSFKYCRSKNMQRSISRQSSSTPTKSSRPKPDTGPDRDHCQLSSAGARFPGRKRECEKAYSWALGKEVISRIGVPQPTDQSSSVVLKTTTNLLPAREPNSIAKPKNLQEDSSQSRGSNS